MTDRKLNETEAKFMTSKCIVADAVVLGLMELLAESGIPEDVAKRASNAYVGMLTDDAMETLIDKYIEEMRKEIKESA